MKLWCDKSDINFSQFHSEQFLLMNLFEDNILHKNKDFINSKDWKDKISKLVTFTSIEDCDYILYPKKLDTGISKYIKLANQYKKQIITFYNDDLDSSINIDSIIVYRTSFNRSHKKKNEYAMPAWSADLLSGDLKLRDKGKIPVVSFCGAITHSVRQRCLDLLRDHRSVGMSFIVRHAFWGGDIHNAFLREEYIANIVNSDLVLCCRGAGNFSYRLYECLSLGRIPIIVDTDTPLPCDDVVKWSDFIITTPDRINQSINDFWEKITLREYYDIQKYARHVYEKYISPSGFAEYLNYTLIK